MGNEGCSVEFELNFDTGGSTTIKMGSWIETYDGNVTMIDLDLSSYAGTEGKFVLRMNLQLGPADKANGFWFVPRVENFAP